MQEKSWALLDRVRPFLPGDPQVLQAEANTWMTLGKPSKSIPLLESAMESQSSDAVMKQFLGWGLLWTGQFEKVIEIGNPWHKAIALSILDRNEEALIVGARLASEGIPGIQLYLLSLNGQHKQIVEFVESRWPDLKAYEDENPDDGGGYGDMLSIARAYSITGNETRFNDAMKRIRAAHDRSDEQGITVNYYLATDARYYALAGDRERPSSVLLWPSKTAWYFPEGWNLRGRNLMCWWVIRSTKRSRPVPLTP
jgi:hypothetical protein